MRTYFRGWGIIVPAPNLGYWFIIDRAHIESVLAHDIQTEDIEDAVRRISLSPVITSKMQLDRVIATRVVVSGTIDIDGLISPSHIAPSPRTPPRQPPRSTSSTMEATASGGAKVVTMSSEEFEEKTHQEFKAGLKKGIQIGIDFLRKVAGKHFQAKEDALAAKLREYAACLEEEQETQRKTSYRVR